MLIEIEKIKAPKIQLRPVLKGTVEYHEMMDSMKKDGVLQPILVRPKGDHYEVVEGNWRYHAAVDVGLREMPCLVKELTDEEVEVIQLKTNAIRPETPRSSVAKRLHVILGREEMTIGQLSRLINKGPSWITKMLTVNKLIDKAKRLLDRGEITVQNGCSLARLRPGLQENFLEHAVILSGPDFADMVRRAVKDYRQCTQQDVTDWIAYRDRHYVAYLRQLAEIQAEIESNRAALGAIRRLEAKTPLDGWRACLAWIYHIDPSSLDKQKVEKGKLRKKRESFANRKQRNEFTLKHLRNISPEINYDN